MLRHEESDIAILVGAGLTREWSPRFYPGRGQPLIDCGDFIAFGCPSEATGDVARFFKGHFQRCFRYSDPAGRSYFAGEMSIPVPAGMSGGPLSSPSTPEKICAIATAIHDLYLLVCGLL